MKIVIIAAIIEVRMAGIEIEAVVIVMGVVRGTGRETAEVTEAQETMAEAETLLLMVTEVELGVVLDLVILL